jgi:ankyrin repeat protein
MPACTVISKPQICSWRKAHEFNAIPGGFDYAGTGLHYAALNGHRAMVEFLVQHAADVYIKDEQVGGTPAGWAEYSGHQQVRG